MRDRCVFIGTITLIIISNAGVALSRIRDTMDLVKTVAQLRPLDKKRVAEITELLPQVPQGLGNNYHDRSTWERLHQNQDYAKIINKAKSLLSIPFPVWDDEKYLMYYTKGTRTEGEQMMDARAEWLTPLVWAECMENKGQFTATIQLVIKELIHQRSWTLPAHDKSRQNFEGRYYTVDLGASVLAHQIAQALYLLDDKIAPTLRIEAIQQMDKHIFQPVLTSLQTGDNKHYWITWTNNWNSVCLAGVTGAALALLPERHERAKFVAIAERYAKNSVAGFTEEGYCTEGLGYYTYGFGHYALLRENIFKATHGEIDLFANPKIKRIAMYVPNLEIVNGVYPSIADCHVGLKAPTDLLWYCNQTLGLELRGYDTLTLKPQVKNLTNNIMQAFPISVTKANASQNYSASFDSLRSYFKEAGVLIVRTPAGRYGNFGAALKGGNNNEIHNHNDVGSFSIAVGNELLMGDPGGPFVYSSRTFGPERYKIRSIGSYGHPVPLLDGQEQQVGASASAKIIKTHFTDRQDEMMMDLRLAYNLPGVTQLQRQFVFERNDLGSLTVTDQYAFDTKRNFEFTLITRAHWRQITSNRIEFDGAKEKMIAIIKTNGKFHIRSESIKEDAPAFTRIGLVLDPAETGSISVVFQPLKSN